MAERVPACAKCGQAMEAGYMLDRSQASVVQSTWVDGAPTPSIWTGLKLKGHHPMPVATYRCTKCGYLESYAASV